MSTSSVLPPTSPDKMLAPEKPIISADKPATTLPVTTALDTAPVTPISPSDPKIKEGLSEVTLTPTVGVVVPAPEKPSTTR